MEGGEYDTSASEMHSEALLRPARMNFGHGGPAPANSIRMRRVRNGVTEALYMSAHGLLTWVGSGTRDDDQDVEQDDDPYGNGRFGAVPALEEIVRLPTATTGEVREKDCAMCLDSFEDGEVLRKMTCASSHAFHQGCIISWLRVSRLCPLCRFALPADQEQDHQQEQEHTESDETPPTSTE